MSISSIRAIDPSAIHDNEAGEIAAITEKVSPVAADLIIIEDSAAGNVKKRVQAGNIPATDSTAIHDNVASEISAITNKVTPAAGDFLLIEDSAAGNIKKHILVSSLPTGGSPPTGTGFRHVTAGVEDGASALVTLTNSAHVAANQGTTTQVLHGNAAGQASWAGVSLTADAAANQGSTTTLLHGNAAGQPSWAGVSLTADASANQGTTTTVLHGNAAGQPSFAAVSLTADVSGILPGANGGTGNGFAALTGPTTSLKTFTLPDASAKILTDNADVLVTEGGTGIGTGTSGGILGFTAATTIASSVALTASQLVIGGGAGATPTPLAAGTNNFILRMGASAPGYEAELLSKDITIEAPTATEDITFFYTPIAITVTEVRVVQVGTTPSVTLVLKHATDRSAAGTDVTTSAAFTSTTTGTAASLSDATIPAASYVWVETTAMSGTVTSTAIHLRYTID